MPKQPNLAFYAARAKAERQMAAASDNEVVAGVHLQLAEHYERMIKVEQAARLVPRHEK
jgi:hypothetical protein